MTDPSWNRFPTLGKQCLSELLGTYLLVFIGPASVVLSSFSGLSALVRQELVALVFGCTVAAAILIFGRYSGAQINPAVSVASAASGRLSRKLLLPFILSQGAGALLAGLSLRLVFGHSGSATSLGSTKLASGVSLTEGMVLEVAGTFVLAVSALIAGGFVRSRVQQAALVGTTLFFLITLVGPLTGASFNPARSLGPSVFSGYLENQLIYYVGPVAGGLVAGLLFSFRARPGGA